MQTKLTSEQSLITKLICAGGILLGYGLSRFIDDEIFGWHSKDDAHHFSIAFGLLSLAAAWLVRRVFTVQAEKDSQKKH